VNWVNHRESLQNLIKDIKANQVELLVILGGNPAYNTPADLKLDWEFLKNFPNLVRVHLSDYKDETTQICQWHIPRAHYLESWSDTRSYDGTATIIQPLIEPLFDGKTAHELLAVFSNQYDRKPYDIVKQYWQKNPGPTNQAQGEQAGANQAQGQRTGAARQQQQPTPMRHQQRMRHQQLRVLRQVRVVILKRGGDRHSTTVLFQTLPSQRRPFQRIFRINKRRQHNNPLQELRWSSVPILQSTTAASQTTAGCKSCRSHLQK
jgi:anaerobic selenocysteine-containing dehydrogenase